MPTYEKNKIYAQKYLASMDELKIRIPKGCKGIVEAHAKAKGESINRLVSELLRADMGLSEWPIPIKEEPLDRQKEVLTIGY